MLPLYTGSFGTKFLNWYLLTLSESGKIAVAYRSYEEVTDARTEEELQDLIQVCREKDSRDTKPG